MTADPYLDAAPPADDEQFTTAQHDTVAEQRVLGAMLMSQDAVGEVAEVLNSRDFYRPNHARIYEAILEVFGAGEAVDPVTVADRLEKAGEAARAGGAVYLLEMAQNATVTANASYHAKIVADLAVRRRIAEAGMKITQIGMSREGDIDAVRNAAEAAVFDATQADGAASEVIPLMDVIAGSIDEIEAAAAGAGGLTGVPTGFTEFDELTNGLHPGQMIVVAARPAMGKSTFALDIARAAAIDPRSKAATVVFSLEMSRTEIGTKILSAESKVLLQHLRKGTLSDADWHRLASAMDRISDAPLFVDDSPNLTMPDIRAKARRLKAQHNLKLVIVDYLQLMSSGKKVESRQQEVSEFSRSLKLLAKELQVPVIALSQLNRGPEQRADKKPMLSDLRESGAIEQDADMVILLNRPEVYEGMESARAGEADIDIAKHRGGPTTTLQVAFQGHYSRFTNLASF